MKYCLALVILAGLAAAGCRSEKNSASSGGSSNTPVIVDGGGTSMGTGTGNGASKSDGGRGAQVVTPTADDSAERSEVRQMDVAELVKALGDARLADAASDELAGRGSEAVDPLIAALDSQDERVKQKAIFTLGQLGPAAKAALPKLQAIAADRQSDLLASSAAHAMDAIEGK